MPHSAPSPTLPSKRGREIRAAADVLRASFLYLSHRRGLQRFVTRQRLTAALAYRFVAGDRLDDAVRVVTDLNRRGFTASLDHLGENVNEEKAARAAADDYLADFERIETDRLNANVSVKITQLGLDISNDLCRDILTWILSRTHQTYTTALFVYSI